MGGGPYYHGAEFRLNFHHTHNAMQLMNDKGADLWSKLMLETLDASSHLAADDPRIRTSINTFLSFFMGKYADEFAFENRSYFGEKTFRVNRRAKITYVAREHRVERIDTFDSTDHARGTLLDWSADLGPQLAAQFFC